MKVTHCAVFYVWILYSSFNCYVCLKCGNQMFDILKWRVFLLFFLAEPRNFKCVLCTLYFIHWFLEKAVFCVSDNKCKLTN
uniref:Uncharacterized protein n=1 Tax=Ciona savignyi TaxID=51511 RepID=H2Z488_CIOSA